MSLPLPDAGDVAKIVAKAVAKHFGASDLAADVVGALAEAAGDEAFDLLSRRAAGESLDDILCGVVRAEPVDLGRVKAERLRRRT